VTGSADAGDKKPTVQDLEKAQRTLEKFQARLREKEKTIEELEKQRQENEEKTAAMLRVARTLELSNSQSKVRESFLLTEQGKNRFILPENG